RDKNVKAWYVDLMRLLFYLLDAISLRFIAGGLRVANADVVIFDRYIYDELANLPLERNYARSYTRFLLNLAPAPDVAYILDATPDEARRRKPEYPVEFLHKNRAAYLEFSKLINTVQVIAPSAANEMHFRIMENLIRRLPENQQASLRLPIFL